MSERIERLRDRESERGVSPVAPQTPAAASVEAEHDGRTLSEGKPSVEDRA